MKRTATENKIKLLFELQEYDLVLTETMIVHGDTLDLKIIIAKVKELRKNIDDLTLSRYDRLYKQGLAIVHERNGMCLGCNMVIGAGDLNRMKGHKIDEICPHCGKFLLLAEVWEEIIAERLNKTQSKSRKS